MYLSLRLQNALIVNAVLFLAYYSLLIWSNNTYLYQLYEYMGASVRPVDITFILTLPLLAVYSSFLCGDSISKPGDVIVALMVLVLFPHAIILKGANQFSPDSEISAGIGLAVLLGVTLLAAANKVRFRKVAIYSSDATRYLRIAGFINVLVLLYIIWQSLSYFSFSYSDQYVRRALARVTFPSGSPISYVASVGTQAVFPVLFAWGIYKKHKAFFMMGIVNALVLWGAFGQKYPFIVLALIFLLMSVMKRAGSVSIKWLLIVGMFSILAGAFEQELLGYSYINDYFLRRVFIVPSTLIGAAERYAQMFGWNFYGDTIVSLLMGSNRTESITFLLGREMFSDTATNANVNYIAVAYLQFGYWGAVIESLVVASMLMLMNGLYTSRNTEVAMPIALLLSTKILEQSLSIVMLSSGVLLMLILLMVIAASSRQVKEIPSEN